MRIQIIFAIAAVLLPSSAWAQDDVIVVGGDNGKGIFHVVVQRDSIENGTVYGTLSVNSRELGTTYENPEMMISAASYSGYIRYYSPTAKSGGHTQGPFGVLGRKGDFLLEVADATADEDNAPKTNILFHGGIRPSDSQGCIMLGPVKRKNRVRYLADSDPLRQLRLAFYGTDLPVESPQKTIVIDIRAIPVR